MSSIPSLSINHLIPLNIIHPETHLIPKGIIQSQTMFMSYLHVSDLLGMLVAGFKCIDSSS